MIKFIISFLAITLQIYYPAFAQTMIKGPALIEGVTSTATAAGTTTLTKDSQTVQVFTGATTQTVTLPDATTLPVGRYFEFYNLSSGAVTVNANGGGLQRTLAASDHAKLTLTDKGTAAGTWAIEKITIDLSDSLLTGTLGIAKGGTGQTTANAAFNALAPSQATNSGKYLTTDGTDVSWADVPSGATSQGQSEATAVSTTNFKAPYDQITTTGTDERLFESGNENLLLNPNFEHSTATTSWTVGLGSSAAVETTEVKSGKKSLAVTVTGLTGFSIYQDVTPTIKTEGSNLEHGVWIKTALTTLTVCARNGGATVGTCATVQADNKWHYYSVLMAGPSSGSVGVSVVTTSSTTGTYYIDAGYVGNARNIGAGVPNNTFSAKVSSAGVVSDENEDFLNGNCSTSSGTMTCNFSTSKFALAPNCAVSAYIASANRALTITSISTSQLVFVGYGLLGTVAAADTGATIVCSRAGTDFIQPTIMPNSWDKDWSSFTPTLTGVGTPSIEGCFYRKNNDSMDLKCTFVTGTVAASAFSITIPNSLQVDSSKNPSSTNASSHGLAYNTTDSSGYPSSAAGPFVVFSDTSVNANLLYISKVSSVGNFSKANGSDIASTTQRIRIEAYGIPIVGWATSQNAPLLVGSVTSNATSAVRTESARIYGGGTNSACTTSPCSVGQIASWISSTTRSGAGAYVVNHTLGQSPYCTLTGSLSPTSTKINPIIVSVSSTVINVEGSDDTSFYLRCEVTR